MYNTKHITFIGPCTFDQVQHHLVIEILNDKHVEREIKFLAKMS